MTDRLEVSRQRAAELHDQAVAKGVNPLDFYKFAKTEAERREIEVSRVPVGDTRLCGGHAVFDPHAWVILHEYTGNPFSDAFLIAHEIGHVEFGGEDEAFTAIDIDENRASGSTGMGTERVVDYSHQQRREVQMDLFAREFLLPRPWLRKLHIKEGKSANEIVRDLKAPRSVVVQQLLDAVLLPVVDIEVPAEHTSQVTYNEQQLDAMQDDGETALLVKAGPGTGKTRTLIGRIEHLLARGESPDGILVLTFSNKAAGELSERLVLAKPDAAARVWVGTFHSFGLDLLRRFHDRLGLPVDPRLLSTSETVEMVEEFYPGLKLKHLRNLQYPAKPISMALKSISRASDEVVDSKRYGELSETMFKEATSDDEILRAEQCLDVSEIFTAYQRHKRERGLLDFGDLVSMPVRLCEEDEEVREYLVGLYRHVLVDEFQDVNRASVRLLKSFCPTGKNLWVVGDARQSIYRFRGASSFNLHRFCGIDFIGGRDKYLTLNYRSVPEINSVVDQFATTMTEFTDPSPDTESTRDANGFPPEIRAVETKIDEADAIADAIQEMREQGYAFRDQAVICKGNSRLADLAIELESRDIPVLFLGNLFERDEIRDLLSLVSVLIDGRAMGLLRLTTINQFAMSINDVATVIDSLRVSEAQPLDWVKEFSFEDVSEAGTQAVQKLRKILKGCHPRTNPWELLSSFLFDHTRIAADLADGGDVASRAKGIAIWQFMNFVKTIPIGDKTPARRLLDQVRQLVLHKDDRELRQLPKAAEGIDAVRLMTMHGSKGLESPIVHVASLTSMSIPQSGKQQLSGLCAPPDGMVDGAEGSGYEAAIKGLEEEQKSLFFVALSRAKDRLFLYRYKKQKMGRNQAKARSQPASKFLQQLGSSVIEHNVVPRAKAKRSGDLPLTEVLVEEPFTLTDYQIALHQKCPARFLYAHVLQIGGRRTETAYMRLHVAVQEVVRTIAAWDGETVSLAQAERMLDQAMTNCGFDAAEASTAYRSIASELIRSLITQTSGVELAKTETKLIRIAGGNISVTPDQKIRRADGLTVLRRIRTGHADSKASDSLEAALLQTIAGSETCEAELLHLGDGDCTPIGMTDRVIGNRLDTLNSIGADIIAGKFPTDADDNCPLCAAYFICGKLPTGKIIRKISR